MTFVVSSKMYRKYVQYIRLVVGDIPEQGLKLKLVNCKFGKTSVMLLMQVITEQGVKMSPARVHVILKTHLLDLQLQLCSFTGCKFP